MHLILFPIFFPIFSGTCLLFQKEQKSRKNLLLLFGSALVITSVSGVLSLACPKGNLLVLFNFMSNLPVLFKIDGAGTVFASITILVFLSAGFFSFGYMKHAQKEKRYYGFFLIVYGVLMGLCFSGNLITFYLFFELLTLTSFPLVLHSGEKEAVMAGLKYLFYSLCGAYMALFGVFFVNRYGNTLTFSEGGVLNRELAAGHEGILLVAAFAMILGFSVKAGMFPLHAWLTSAHPVAPSPASAVLSAVIVKAGALGILRTVYYLFGVSFLRGSWVQTAFMVLSLITIFMGSMLAYREPVLKKRLAYSTISQVSYILFGFSVMDLDAVTGSFLHVICHGLVKAVLFFCAGVIIYQTKKTRAEELSRIGKEMPLLLWCYSIASLGLIGIPPMGGFVSKWYLAVGSLETHLPLFSWLGPVVLLVSALLTAGYLLPVTIHGFFPGEGYDYQQLQKKKIKGWMMVPIFLLTGLSALMGLFPNALVNYIQSFAVRFL